MAIPWINDVSTIFGEILTYFLIGGVAFVPGFAMSFVYSTLLLDKRFKNIELKNLPPITILIAAYNEENNIVDTLESIKKQEYDGVVEVIVCNDGSTDKTSELVKDFIRKNNNGIGFDFKIIDIEKNVGKSQALNNGLIKSVYDIIITVDADTTLHSNSLKSIVTTLENRDKNTVAVAGTILVNNANKNLMTKIQYWDYLLGISSVKQAQSAYNGTLVAQGAFSAYKKKNILEIGGWPNCVGEDIVLTWNLLKRGYDVYHDTNSIVYTNVPENYKQFFKQRKRWSRGLIEAFKSSARLLVKPRKILPFIWYNFLFPYVDSSFSFVFIPSIIAAIFFNNFLMAGMLTLLLLPLGFSLNAIIFMIQKRILKQNNIKMNRNIIGLIFFVLFYQTILVPATLSGYVSEFLNLRKKWETK